MIMNTLTHAFIATVKNYLRFLPIIVIPVAGLLFMVTVAPYLAVNDGCKEFRPRERKNRRKLALSFGLTISTLLSVILILLSYFIMPIFLIRSAELSIIILLYASFILFSLLGTN